MALAADVRIAGPKALFDARFQKLGLHPGGGATWMLQRGVGPQVARAALLFGMRFDAESAVRHGLALSVADDPVAAALELAAGPAAAPREVVLATKATMRATASPGSLDAEQHELPRTSNSGRRPPRSSHRSSPPDWPRRSGSKRDRYRSSSAVSGDSISLRSSPRNCATLAPSATRWSNTQVSVIWGRTTTVSSSGHRPRFERPHAQDRGLRIVDHRHAVIEPERPEVRHGKRRAGKLGRFQRACPGVPNQPRDAVSEFARGLVLRVSDHRDQQTAGRGDRETQMDRVMGVHLRAVRAVDPGGIENLVVRQRDNQKPQSEHERRDDSSPRRELSRSKRTKAVQSTCTLACASGILLRDNVIRSAI